VIAAKTGYRPVPNMTDPSVPAGSSWGCQMSGPVEFGKVPGVPATTESGTPAVPGIPVPSRGRNRKGGGNGAAN